MTSLTEMTPELARHILDRMGSTGQPPERGAGLVNVATDGLLKILREEYLLPMKASGRNSTFKLVQAPFGGGKTHFLHCLREMAWSEGFATALVGLSPKECPFDRPVAIYKEVVRRFELPVTDIEEEPSQGFERALVQIARARIAENGAEAFVEWLQTEFAHQNIESRAFCRGVRLFMEAVAMGDLDDEETLADYLLGEDVPRGELARFRLRESLTDECAFRWLRSLTQVLAALGSPGIVLMFDEMDRNMSLSGPRRRAIGDNLRQMIDYCGQSKLPGVVWCYAVPPEFMDTIVPEYPALAQRLKGARSFSSTSPMQPVIDLDHLPIGTCELLETIGVRLLNLSALAYEHTFDESVQKENIAGLARELGERSFESGTRRTFVKAVVTMIEAQRREGESALGPQEIRELAGSSASELADFMPGEAEF
ncbi:MAG: BREX system ATP-binding domain-containing protein [bacterium]|jgi:hypothetical protein|nr:hypothetical protein [Planctomycetota bacterium]HIL51024.1 hypothetical protein [Planctomycetota bacterium]